MKKLEKRAILCILLAAVLGIGMLYFIGKLCVKGSDWVSSYTNRATHSDGVLNRGAVYDANGDLLIKNTKNGMEFNSDKEIREALVHITGDKKSNIATGVNNCMADKLVGYNLLTGTYSFSGTDRTVNLTIDSEACRAAYEAMGYHSGAVGVYNYKTGEILCAYSSPNYDPTDPPQI